MDYFGMTWRSKSNQIKSPRKAYDALILSIPALSMLETELPYMANSNRWTTLGFVLSIITSLTHISHAYLTIFTILNLTLHFQTLLPYTLYVYSTPILALFSSIPNSFALASFIEVAFYLFMTLKNQWYQSLNPSVYNLKTAPRNVTISQRSETFKCILRSEESKVQALITGWFFDAQINSITSSDAHDFLSWTFFEGRKCEHLNEAEAAQLFQFRKELESAISNETKTNFEFNPERKRTTSDAENEGDNGSLSSLISETLKEVKDNIKETFKDTPVGDGFKMISDFKSGYDLRKKLSHQKAKFLDDKINAVLSELKFQKKLLDYNSEMDKVDSKVDSFHKITRLTIRLKILRSLQNGESLQSIEWGKKPKKFAKFNFSKLYDIIIWPFFFHVLLYFYSSVVMNVILRLKGFEPVYKGSRRCWHLEQSRETANNNTTPICFIHGIGIGLMPYLSLIGKLQKTARPIILLEVSEVSAFRCFDFNKKVYNSSDVNAYVNALLNDLKYVTASFVGHSYGTSWLSYLHKRSPKIIENITYIDPICFKIHCSDLVKSFVYQKSDRGNVACLIRGDLNVRWVMQREFCWNDICLFREEMGDTKTNVFLSEDDCLVPSKKVAEGFEGKRDTKVYSSDEYDKFAEGSETVRVCVLNEKDHGDFLADGVATDAIVNAISS
ncbi:hypothetical protein TrLO_g7517 [Triparma laevis f. longispina]|uniref:Uncharacterized protein n=1 Tax=Triparma laevis f. longispina TaxID=1714387 RepID=A0A9W7AMH4_9STRA|nr:hypothetical protein TrLO_g7517 [Triparma laevis f. longispina]